MKLRENKIFKDLVFATSCLGLLLIGIYQYDKLVTTDIAEDSLSAKQGKALFYAFDSFGGKKLVFGILASFATIGYTSALYKYLKQEKIKKTVDFKHIFENGGKIEFDEHELEIIKATRKGKKFNGYGKLYFYKNPDNWRAVTFSNLLLTFDGKSNLTGKYEVITPETWVKLGEDINEIFSNYNYAKNINYLTEKVYETGKCPFCNFQLDIFVMRCPNCKSFLRLDEINDKI